MTAVRTTKSIPAHPLSASAGGGRIAAGRQRGRGPDAIPQGGWQGWGGQQDRKGGLRFPVGPTIGPIRNDRRCTIKGQLLRLKWGQSRKERAMHLQLDENGPLHSQLTRALKTAMRSGLVGGSRLPATRQLANELEIGRASCRERVCQYV